jgi:hypothetical protein
MRVLPSLIVVVSVLAAVPAADAQWRSQRPYRGLFAGGVDDAEHLLTASGSVGTGWDSNLVADALNRAFSGPSDVTRQFRGGVSTGSAALSYSLNKTAVSFGATAGTTLRYYPSLSNHFIRREYASVGASAILGAGFSAQGSAIYQPYNVRSLMPSLFDPRLGDPSIVDEDFPASTEHYLGYSGGLGYSRQLTRRQTFSMSYGYRGREPVAQAGRFDSHSAGADLRYAVSNGLNLRFGYGYTVAYYGDRQFEGHVIDAGVDYNRALSFSRRTTLSFGTGSTATRRARNDSLRFRLNGSARLNHEIGRSWNATIAYNRGLVFLETWPEPVFSDSASAGVGGLISRRVTTQVSARWVRGRGYFNPDGDQLETYGGGAVVSVAITRYISTGVTYSYYLHDFADRVTLAPGLPTKLERQSVRAYVSMWVPLFQSSRRP